MPGDWRVISPDLVELNEDLRQFTDRLHPVVMEVLRYADTRVSARAIGTYMRDAGGGPGNFTEAGNINARSPNDQGALRIVSGTLARSVRGGIGGILTPNVLIDIEVNEGIVRYVKTLTLPYAAIHEYGGTIKVPITRKMRRFFWAMWYASGDEKWMGMALTRQRSFTIHIPARPYMGPAIVDETPKIQDFARRRFESHAEKYIEGGRGR